MSSAKEPQKKYEFTGETKDWFGTKMCRIRSLIEIRRWDVKKGDIGGWIEKEENLSQVSGDAWVSGNAQVSGTARVSGDARVYGNAEVSGNARVSGDAHVSEDARVFGDAWVSEDARVYGDAWVSGDARVYGNAEVFGNAQVSGTARVSGDARVYGNAEVSGNAHVSKTTEYLMIGPIGSRNATMTAWQEKGITKIAAGCYLGSIKDFKERVSETHAGTEHEKNYLAALKFIEEKFKCSL